jgi:hypothetical protein
VERRSSRPKEAAQASISSWVRSGAEGETGVGVVRKGRAATGVVRALLLGLAVVHVLVLVLGDGVKPSAVGRAREMTSRRRRRSGSGLGIMMTKKLAGVGWVGGCLCFRGLKIRHSYANLGHWQHQQHQACVCEW